MRQPPQDPGEAWDQVIWDQVIRRRVEELEAGIVETIPWHEVRAELFAGFELPSDDSEDSAD